MILVTGGTGYLGRALVARLVADGEQVRVLTRGRSFSGDVDYLSGDVTQPAQVDAAMQGVGRVYHLAAMVDHHATPAALARVNVQGTINVVEAAHRHGVERVIHCSSVSAEPGGGSTAYGRSKIAAEAALADWQQKIPIIILRPGPVYDQERRNLRQLVRFVRYTRLCPRLWPDITLHLASRRNVTDAFMLAGTAGIAGRAYAVCDRAPVCRSLLARILCEEIGAIPLPVPLPVLYPLLYGFVRGDRHYLRVLTRARRYDITPAIAELGYLPVDTETAFAAAVRGCLTGSAQEVPGEG